MNAESAESSKSTDRANKPSTKDQTQTAPVWGNYVCLPNARLPKQASPSKFYSNATDYKEDVPIFFKDQYILFSKRKCGIIFDLRESDHWLIQLRRNIQESTEIHTFPHWEDTETQRNL